MTSEILRSFDAFDAEVSSGGMFATGSSLPGAARSVYATLGGSVRYFSLPAGFRFLHVGGLSLALKKGKAKRSQTRES